MILRLILKPGCWVNWSKTSLALKKLIELIDGLGKSLFTGQLSVHFYRGNVGKIQLTRTIKSSELDSWLKMVDLKKIR